MRIAFSSTAEHSNWDIACCGDFLGGNRQWYRSQDNKVRQGPGRSKGATGGVPHTHQDPLFIFLNMQWLLPWWNQPIFLIPSSISLTSHCTVSSFENGFPYGRKDRITGHLQRMGRYRASALENWTCLLFYSYTQGWGLLPHLLLILDTTNFSN